MSRVGPGAEWGPGSGPTAGLRALVPGYAQWSWRQRRRGLLLFGAFASGASAAVFAWGTPTGLAILAYAFAAHAVSAVDAVRQGSFPSPGRWATRLGVPGGLALGLYAPLLAGATLVAWPASGGGDSPTGYLVNRCAYQSTPPRPDDWVWFQPGPPGRPRAGRVVAAEGQEVDWSDDLLRVNGRPAKVRAPFQCRKRPDRLTYRVPQGHALVEPEPGPGDEGLVIVAREQIVGRAWARYYPIRNRHLLN